MNETVHRRAIKVIKMAETTIFPINHRQGCCTGAGCRNGRKCKHRQTCPPCCSLGGVQSLAASHAKDHLGSALFGQSSQFFHPADRTVGTESLLGHNFQIAAFQCLPQGRSRSLHGFGTTDQHSAASIQFTYLRHSVIGIGADGVVCKIGCCRHRVLPFPLVI